MTPWNSEADRLEQFPVAANQTFLGHAGVTALPRCAAEAMRGHISMSCENHQEFGAVLADVGRSRKKCADLIGAQANEIALLGPTSLGLSLFANGLDWNDGDELICYGDDYPANVYPWINLERKGVRIVYLKPDIPGRITPELVEAAITPKTRLLALASCHFLTGWRIDIDAIGQIAQSRGVLFSLDAIQTLGAFSTRVDHVDFLSADAHKWLLGPLAIGIVYVSEKNFELCRPTLLGAWNIKSPQFITQSEITFTEGAQRYEPGVLNLTGLYGMMGSIELLTRVGLDRVSAMILARRDQLHTALDKLGFESFSPPTSEPLRSGILTVRHPRIDSSRLFATLESEKITASLRMSRDGRQWLRFSPHFYNTDHEMDRVADVLAAAIQSTSKEPVT